MYKVLFIILVCVPFWTFVHMLSASEPRLAVMIQHRLTLP
jgi:hypothetical protein